MTRKEGALTTLEILRLLDRIKAVALAEASDPAATALTVFRVVGVAIDTAQAQLGLVSVDEEPEGKQAH